MAHAWQISDNHRTVAIALTAPFLDAQQTNDPGRNDRRFSDEITRLRVGSRVAVNARCLGCVRYRGELVRATNDTLWLRNARDTSAFSARSIVSLDTASRDRRRGASRGMKIGFISGGPFAVAVAQSAGNNTNSALPPRASAVLGFVVFGGAGAIVGGIVGAVTAREKLYALPAPWPPT